VRTRQWFWRASFSERYRVGGENFISKDLEDVKDFVLQEKGNAKQFGELGSLVKTSFRISNSRTHPFALALALRQARNITNGAATDTAMALSGFNKKQFHHIYPKAFLHKIGDSNDSNSIVNVCMLAASENNAVSDSDPQEYLPTKIAALGDKADGAFFSNILPSPSAFDYKNSTYAEFLKEREMLLAPYLNLLCDGHIS